jgi:hypothetical protein
MPRISSVIRPPVIAGGGGITATLEWVASDTLQQSADTERYDTDAGYTKKKEIRLDEDIPVIRVKFDMKSNPAGGGYPTKARIYLNGAAIGTERTRTTNTYTTYSEDLDNGGSGFSSGDLIQLYLNFEYGGSYPDYCGYCRNFRLYASNSITEIDEEELVTSLALTDVLATTVTLN